MKFIDCLSKSKFTWLKFSILISIFGEPSVAIKDTILSIYGCYLIILKKPASSLLLIF